MKYKFTAGVYTSEVVLKISQYLTEYCDKNLLAYR